MTAPTAPRRAVRDRCAVHPARPSVGRCPVCDRPRCGADAVAAPGGGCLACNGGPAAEGRSVLPPTDLERLIRATLAALAAALLGGLVASEYVGAGLFSYIGPFVVGVICGGSATKAAGTDGRGPLGTRVRAVGALLGVLGVGFGFVHEQSQHPVLDGDVLLPYLAAVAGALLWTMPPRPRANQGASTDA